MLWRRIACVKVLLDTSLHRASPLLVDVNVEQEFGHRVQLLVELPKFCICVVHRYGTEKSFERLDVVHIRQSGPSLAK